MSQSAQVLPRGVRVTSSGSFEATIYHSSLAGGRVARSFDDPESAATYRENRLRELRAGTVLPELIRAPYVGVKLTVILREYLNSDTAKIAPSDRPTVIRLQNTMTASLKEVTTTWVDDWVRQLKRVDKVAPSTIRKKCESLARAIDWWTRKEYPNGGAPTNPLRTLPVGYSSYDEADVPRGGEIVEDVKRDRRLHEGEYELLELVIKGTKLPGRERAWGAADRDAFLLLFQLITNTGLRLREAYSLRVSDLDFKHRLIRVNKSKTSYRGRDQGKRIIPTTRHTEGLVRPYLEAQSPSLQSGDLLFPFWSGSTDGNVLRDTTISMSKRFRKLFAYAGCDDLREHDLRHEAVCRWFDMKKSDGTYMYRPEEIQKIAGHKSAEMFMRYLSLRGSDLAGRD